MRIATEDDRKTVEEIVRAAYEPWIEVIGTPPLPLESDYRALIEAGHVHLDGDRALIVLIPEPDVLLVDNVAVRPGLHGQGIGRELLAFAEAEARRLGLSALRLYTNVKMARNIRLYESLGYVSQGVVGLKGRQAVHFRKEL
ncbi:GNAT family N-acetyltransferase [Nonomuraea sp. NPDC050310]|uniref:GNAT family N-acetyltransferase n=1 Tax=unclassified Nonomuraea TaxID=2593643 RepID=UPI0034011E83